jgi:hypothetical protein
VNPRLYRRGFVVPFYLQSVKRDYRKKIIENLCITNVLVHCTPIFLQYLTNAENLVSS